MQELMQQPRALKESHAQEMMEQPRASTESHAQEITEQPQASTKTNVQEMTEKAQASTGSHGRQARRCWSWPSLAWDQLSREVPSLQLTVQQTCQFSP